ncbi:general substrate transporter [Xylariaceae sp. FL0804]|nr:general substrate transporter [Xylariaceae sp. FL0804]
MAPPEPTAAVKMDPVDDLMASQAALAEHDMTIWQALRKHRKAAAWSMLVSTCVIMRAYDIDITSNFYALPAFARKFGEEVPGHGYQVPTAWQVGMSCGAIVGQIVGSPLVAVPMDRLGRRPTLALYLGASVALVFMQVFAPGRAVLLASMYLAGLVWGGYQVLAPTYAAEVLPLRLRGFFTGYVNLCYVVGQFLETGVTRGVVGWPSDWAWRVPYAVQWAWPVFILALLAFAPESPWWLVRQGRLDDARRALDRLSSRAQHRANADVLAMMVRTDAYERELQVGATWRDVFRGANRRRLEICSMVFITQNFSGSPTEFATYLFEQTGLSTASAFDMGIGINAVAFVGNIGGAWVMTWFGRRNSWLWGLAYCLVVLWVVGFLCLAPSYYQNLDFAWAQAVLLITMEFIYSLTVGPLALSISSEIPSTRLRAKTLSACNSINGITYLVIEVASPYLLNPAATNAGAKIEFLWGGLTLFTLIWSYFRLPETGNRTYEELDQLFEERVPTRKFATHTLGSNSTGGIEAKEGNEMDNLRPIRSE